MWIIKTENSQIVEHTELMFYTRFAKTLIGVRVGAKVKCGGIECDVDDVTHFDNKPEPPKPSQNADNKN